MFRLALKSVRHNPKRLILTTVAVTLGVSLVAATFTFTSAFSRGFNELFSDIYSTVDVVVEHDPNADDNYDPMSKDGLFTAEDLAAVRAVDGIESAEAGVGYEMGTLLNKEGDAPLLPGPPTLIYNWTDNPDVDRATVIEGRTAEATNETTVDIDTFKRLKIDLGDTVKVAGPEGVTELTVVGTIRFGENNDLQTAMLLYTTEDTVRAIGGGLTGYDTIEATVTDGADPDEVAAAVQKVLPENTRAISAEAKVKEQTDQLDEALKYVNIFALVFGLIALFVGAYIIVNTFRIIVTQRTRELGLLRAIGAKGKQIRTMILLEAVVVGIVASTIGIGLGYLLALGGSFLVEMFTGDLLGSIILPINAIVWGYLLGTLITVVAATLPAIHASRISPMEALREAGTAGKKPLTVRNIVGGAFTLTGLAAIFIGLYGGVEGPQWWVAAGAVLIVLGVTLLAAQVLVPAAFGLRGVLSRLWGVNGKLAANNIRREPRRSANTAAALMIGVMLLALVATFTESLKDTFTSQFKGNEAELLVMATTAPVPQGAMDVIADVDGVRAVARLGFTNAEYEGSTYAVTYIDAAITDGLFPLNTDRPLSDIGDGVFIDPTIQKLGVEVGDEVTIEGEQGPVTLTVTGLYTTEGDQAFMVEWETGLKLTSEPQILQGLVDFDEGADVDATSDAVKDALLEDYPLVQPQSPSQIEQFFDQVLTLLIGVISALLGAALVIAILGVANTLLLSVTERTREIGLLRAVGIKRSAVWGMITLESVVMAVFGTLLGIVLGVGLGAALVDALSNFGFERVVIPWVWIAIYTVLSMIAGVLAAVWPAWRASRLDILKAIAADG
jgi:putative ABC transport system permease protein